MGRWYRFWHWFWASRPRCSILWGYRAATAGKFAFAYAHSFVCFQTFSAPAAFLARLQSLWGTLADRLLLWTSSLLATSLESIPRAWNLPCDSKTLFTALQPLPYSTRQRALLSTHEAAMWDFDLVSQTWFLASSTDHFCPQPPWFEPRTDSPGPPLLFAPWPRQYLTQSGDAADWSRRLLFDLRHSALHCCLHQVLVKDKAVHVEVREDPHQSMWWLKGVNFGPKRLVCRGVGGRWLCRLRSCGAWGWLRWRRLCGVVCL